MHPNQKYKNQMEHLEAYDRAAVSLWLFKVHSFCDKTIFIIIFFIQKMSGLSCGSFLLEGE